MSVVLNGLAKKYQELAGEVQTLMGQVEAIRKDQDALKAAMKIIDPDFKIPGKPVKRRNKNTFFPHGQSMRFVMDTLREASAPISTKQMAERAAAHLQLDPEAFDFNALKACMLTALSRMRSNGSVVEMGRDQDGTIKWRLAAES